MTHRNKEILINVLIIIAMFGIAFMTIFFATGASLKNDVLNYCKNKKYYEEANPGSISEETKFNCEQMGITI